MVESYGNKAKVHTYDFDKVEYYSVQDAAMWLGVPQRWLSDAARIGRLKIYKESLTIELKTRLEKEEMFIPKDVVETIAQKLDFISAYVDLTFGASKKSEGTPDIKTIDTIL